MAQTEDDFLITCFVLTQALLVTLMSIVQARLARILLQVVPNFNASPLQKKYVTRCVRYIKIRARSKEKQMHGNKE